MSLATVGCIAGEHDRYTFCSACCPGRCDGDCDFPRYEWSWRYCPICGEPYENTPDDLDLDGAPIWGEDEHEGTP